MRGFAAGFVLGAAAGAITACVVMQEETRDTIFGKAREAGNFARDATADLYERGKNVVENARSNISDAVDEGNATASHLRDDLSRQNYE